MRRTHTVRGDAGRGVRVVRGYASFQQNPDLGFIKSQITDSNQITNSNFKPKPNKARFKQKPNKAQTGYKMRGESFNTDLEASVDDLHAIPNLLINLDLEVHGVPIGPTTRRLSHYDPTSKTTPFGR